MPVRCLSDTPNFRLQLLSIIFVHGLRGHRLNSWTKQGICWPKDLLPREPALSNVRILSFGYDSRVVDFGGHPSLNSLFNHSISLLNGLCRERRDVVGLVLVLSLVETEFNEQNRPIIFVAHSLGGLIVKDVRHQIHQSCDLSSLQIIIGYALF